MKFIKRINIFNTIESTKMMIFLIIFVFLVLIFLGRMIYVSYTYYRDTMVIQQEQHLLTIAKSTARNLELFVVGKADNLKIIAGNPKFQKRLNVFVKDGIAQPDISSIKAFYEVQKKEIQSVALYDDKGKLIYHCSGGTNIKISEQVYNSVDSGNNDVNYVLKTQQSYIGSVYQGIRGDFVFNILQPVFYKERFIGILVATINLNTLYNHLVKPVKVGKKGYVMVKDKKGIILMHPVKEQIGTHVIMKRKEKYPGLNFTELKNLIKRQLTGKEGTAVYHSYWWPDSKLVMVKKLTGFAPAHIGDDFWIVATPMSYEEIADPIKENLLSTLLIAGGFIIIFSSCIFLIIKIQKNKEALEIETKYLKELNETTDELRKSEAQLRHSQKIQTIGTLTGGIAHEFNNLLTPILGYAELMLKDLSQENYWYEDINEIYEAAKKSKELIKQILIFSHRDNNKHYKPVKINELIKETLKLVKSILPSNIDIIENFEDCGYILANPTQINQVIFNLCTNAYDAMKKQGGLLEISMYLIDKDDENILNNEDFSSKKYVKISVKDTGCGMKEKVMHQIFDPFFTTKAVGEGTGLGLSVVHGIVASHNGKIFVESKIGKGSVFNVYFPQMEGQYVDLQNNNNIVLKGNETILLIDDDPSIVNMMKKRLEKLGYKIIAQTNSLKALKIFKKNPPRFQLIITDQTMHHLNGIGLAEKAKAIYPEIKVILMTGFVNEPVKDYINSPLIDDYIIKPVLLNELSQKIRRVLMVNQQND
ncbi:MAG: response regulator [Firmicutes bacterium]|nr:response regulator [Bacillota bacterium]